MKSARLLFVALLATATVLSGEFKPPESPKDDEHWYPEFPENKELNSSLVNGDFEQNGGGAVAHPKGWAHPEQLCIYWTDDVDAKHGKVVMLDTDVLLGEAQKRQAELREALAKGQAPAPAEKKTTVSSSQQYNTIGGNNGVSFYSEKIKVKPKQAYKINFDFKGPSGGAKLWIRGWGQTTDKEGVLHDRRLWENIVFCRVKEHGWRHFEQAFHPTRRPGAKKLKKDPKKEDASAEKQPAEDAYKYVDVVFMRVMLYAYWPRGQYYFDNLKIEEISDEEYDRLKKIPADER